MSDKPGALALLIRKMASQGDEDRARDIHSSNLFYKNPMVHTIIALLIARKPCEKLKRSEDPKTYKRTRITPKNMYMSDSEPYTSDSDEEQPRRKRTKLKPVGQRPKKRKRRESDAISKSPHVDDHTISTNKEQETATTIHSDDSGYSDTDATDGEEVEEEEEDGGEVAEDKEQGSETTTIKKEEGVEKKERGPNRKIIKWSMPPRLHYVDATGYNYKSINQLLVNASKGYVDLNGVKLRLKVIHQ